MFLLLGIFFLTLLVCVNTANADDLVMNFNGFEQYDDGTKDNETIDGFLDHLANYFEIDDGDIKTAFSGDNYIYIDYNSQTTVGKFGLNATNYEGCNMIELKFYLSDNHIWLHFYDESNNEVARWRFGDDAGIDNGYHDGDDWRELHSHGSGWYKLIMFHEEDNEVNYTLYKYIGGEWILGDESGGSRIDTTYNQNDFTNFSYVSVETKGFFGANTYSLIDDVYYMLHDYESEFETTLTFEIYDLDTGKLLATMGAYAYSYYTAFGFGIIPTDTVSVNVYSDLWQSDYDPDMNFGFSIELEDLEIADTGEWHHFNFTNIFGYVDGEQKIYSDSYNYYMCILRKQLQSILLIRYKREGAIEIVKHVKGG